MDFDTARTQINDILDQLEATYDPPPPFELPTANLAYLVDPRSGCLDNAGQPCADGSGVWQLTTADSNAYVGTQADVGKQFLWQLGQNGMPYLEGSQAAARELTFPLISLPQPLTIYIVSKLGDRGQGQTIVGRKSGNNQERGHFSYRKDTGAIRFDPGDGADAEFAEQVIDGPVHIHAIVLDGANSTAQQNDGQPLIGWNDIALLASSNLQIDTFGGGTVSYYNFDGHIYLFAIYSGVHDAATQQAIKDGLGQRFNGVWIPPAGADPNAVLPQIWPDDVTGRDWLGSLTEADHSVPHTPVTWASSGASVRDLFGHHQSFGSLGNRQPRNDLLRIENKAFVLDNGSGDGIEGDGSTVRTQVAASGDLGLLLEAAALAKLKNEHGFTNPYYQHSGAATRLCSQAMANMLQLRYMAEWGLYGSFPEAVGMSCMQAMEGWEAGKAYAVGLTQEIKDAYYRTVHAIFARWADLGGPKTVNTNMDCKTWLALARLYVGATEEGHTSIAADALKWAKRYMLGDESYTSASQAEGWRDRVVFHAAGYVGEKHMPETSYFGISIYYLCKSALVVRGLPGWEWLWDADGIVDRMATWAAHQTYMDPDGSYNGPSGHCVRGGAPCAEWQSHSHGIGWAIGTVSDEGLAIFGRRVNNSFPLVVPPIADVESRITAAMAESGYSNFTSIPPQYNSYTSGGEWRWARRISTVASEFYDPADYDAALTKIGTEAVLLPSDRAAGHSRFFGPDQHDNSEFWSVKDTASNGQDFAYFVEAFTRDPNVGTGYGSLRVGGSVQAFATRDAGLVICSRSHKHDDPTMDWPAIATWPCHHMWGTFGDDSAFSACQKDTRITEHTWYGATCNGVRVESTNTPDRQSGSYVGQVTYDRKIERITDGLRITVSLTTDGQDFIKTLQETLPIYISLNNTTNAPTTVEYTTNGTDWLALPESWVGGITAVRLGRDHGFGAKYLYVAPSVAVRMQLGVLWQENYQVNNHYRQLTIDMHPASGVAQTLPSASLTYEIRPRL